MTFPDQDTVLARSRQWLERAVIGLNLCPFAKSVHVKGQIRWVVSAATDAQGVLTDLLAELRYLAEVSPEETDTTLLVLPRAMADFMEFNDFMGVADEMLEELALDGVLQVANFHPQFQFADTDADDVSNNTNRAPWPTLHLIREESIDRAVEVFPEAETIYERNIELMHKLGAQGWADLFKPDAP